MGVKRVRDLMQTRPVTISADERLSTVEDIMRLGRVRHMPVVRAGSLVGVTQEQRAFLHGVEIHRVMSDPPITIHPEASLEEAAHMMAEGKIGCLPVLDGEQLVGLVTETDLLSYFAGIT
jgi:CBS domain-containing protein